MWLFNLLILTTKQIYRHPVRSILTITGVCTGTFLFLCVETMQYSLHQSTQSGSDDDTLVVFRKDRFCPHRRVAALLDQLLSRRRARCAPRGPSRKTSRTCRGRKPPGIREGTQSFLEHLLLPAAAYGLVIPLKREGLLPMWLRLLILRLHRT